MLKLIPLLALLLISAHANAEQLAAQTTAPAISDARSLIEHGRDNDAIGVLGRLVKSSPKDFQAWFLLGVTQAKQRRFHDAVISFGKVAALQPKLAEPHNNLAVIYNELGDFRAAVKELEASLQLKPDYATAHENIGDLYVKLAADAYRKALDAGDRPALRQRYDRLLHIRDAHKPEVASEQQALPTARSVQTDMEQQPAGQQDSSQAEIATASEPERPDQPVANGKPIEQPLAQQPAPQTTVLDTEKPAASDRTGKATEPQHATRSAMAAVEAWRSAWNRQDLPAYFAAYSDAFDFGPRFETLQQWKHYKQWVIAKRTFIRVTLENIEAKILPNGEISLVFLQHFRSDSFNSDDIKKILLRQSRDGWKIIHETSQ